MFNVFCLILCVLCIIDATLILRKVTFNRAAQAGANPALAKQTYFFGGGSESQAFPRTLEEILGAGLARCDFQARLVQPGRASRSERVLSFTIFICYIASTAAPFMMVPLLTFLLALCFFVSYSLKLNEKFRGIYWLLAVFGFIATVVYCAYVYFTFNDLATFLKQEDSSETPKPQKSENDSDSDSD
ncbi:CKLF-like MARVEL transmembrane domain-containing protein 3 [Crotalus adamanteus]|uniref:CKLF-like MARVEL transmembrane domain-containing protein 3 n=1 Tax=Crotalus adamanteus TaxID=8729 RepID=A0AAW1ASN2_CROAD